jgi:Glycosyl hydrolases family 31
LIQAAHYAHDEVSWELTDQYMFGADMMVAPVLNPVGSDTSSQANAEARNGGSHSALAVSTVKVYLPAKSVWIHLWTGQRVEAGDKGRYVAVDAPIGYPPVFFLPDSSAGLKLREFVMNSGYAAALSSGPSVFHTASRELLSASDSDLDSAPVRRNKKYTVGAVIGDISDYVAPDWAQWLGISQYVSKWNSTYYSLPSAAISDQTVISSAEFDSSSSSVSSTQTLMNEPIATAIIDANSVAAANTVGNSLMFQDIDVDLSSLFYTST